MITTVTYSMPVDWASYLINNDPSGLDDDEIAEADAAIADIDLGSPVDVSESEFRRGGDYGSLAGDYADYTFHVIEEEATGPSHVPNVTIYEALYMKLGREPTNEELKAEVQRIKTAALVEAAGRGQLSHQKTRRRHTPNEDLTWREVYSREYHNAAARGLEPWQAREEASRAAWADYAARTGQPAHFRNPPLWESDDEAEYMRLLDRYDAEMEQAGALEDEGLTARAAIHRRAAEAAMHAADRISKRYAANGTGYYVWALARKSDKPLSEGPWGPYETLESAKTFARIGATEGAHDRAVSLGFDPESVGFRILRRYQGRSGDRIL